jgi:hypothetical protein
VRASTVITSARAGWVIQVLLPGDHPLVAILLRAGLERAEVGAGVGLGEHGRRQDLGGGDLGSHSSFCASVPPHRISSAAISERVPSEPTPI